MSRPESLRPLEAYPRRMSAQIRYSDMDRQGHVNNAVFATFSEIGRVALFYDERNPFAPPGYNLVVAKLTIDYYAELFWPGHVEIGTGVSRIGRSSFTVVQGLFSAGRCVAGIEAVKVLIGSETRRSAPLPADAVATLEELMLR